MKTIVVASLNPVKAQAANLGFQEMVQFYQKASKAEQAEMDKAVKSDNFDLFKKYI